MSYANSRFSYLADVSQAYLSNGVITRTGLPLRLPKLLLYSTILYVCLDPHVRSVAVNSLAF